MHHQFMKDMSDALLRHNVATLRYQFPYMEQGRRMPDRPPRLLGTVRAAATFFKEIAPQMMCVVGGKSMGGRMSSMALSQGLLEDVSGIVFFGFPLHPANKPSYQRSEHLKTVLQPKLFIQGTRDKLAPMESMSKVVADLIHGDVFWIETADHGFAVLKSSALTADQVLEDIASKVANWILKL